MTALSHRGESSNAIRELRGVRGWNCISRRMAKPWFFRLLKSGADNLWLQPLDGSRGRQITNFKSDGISSFRFSPDGKTLGVMSSHGESDVVLLRDMGSSPQ
jgi:hypothetical protein